MPRPGQTPTPAYQTGEALPYGSATDVASLAAALPLLQNGEDAQEPEDYQPQSPDEQFLLSPTDRPEEPMTTGVGFGPGADFTRFAYEDDQDVLRSVAVDLANSDSPELRAYAERVARGL